MITIQELNDIREKTLGKMDLKLIKRREEIFDQEKELDKRLILICGGPGCHSSNVGEIKDRF